LSREYVEALLVQYKNKGVLVDANLLLLFFVGLYDRGRISTFKGTKTFTAQDFELLKVLFSYFSRVMTTPNILTEVSNLSNQLRENEKERFYSEFASGASRFHENYTSSAEICETEHFKKFGLTDSGIIAMVTGQYLVLTDDFKLSNYLQNAGVDAINFNHIRVLNWR